MTKRFVESSAISVGILFVGDVASQTPIVFQQCAVGIYGGFKTGGKVPLLEFLNPATVLFILRECQILCHNTKLRIILRLSVNPNGLIE